MNKQKALSNVASMLAYSTVDHIDSTNKIPALLENATQAAEKNLNIAKALEIEPQYFKKIALYRINTTNKNLLKAVYGK